MMSETKFKTFYMQTWWLTTKFWAPLILHLLGSLLRTVLTLFRQPTALRFQNQSLRFVQYSIDNYMESFAFHIKGVKADLQFVYQILEVKFVKSDKILRLRQSWEKFFCGRKIHMSSIWHQEELMAKMSCYIDFEIINYPWMFYFLMTEHNDNNIWW